MTRQDYLDGRVSHAEYYRTIAKEAGVSFDNSTDLSRIIKALGDGDEHLNSIPLSYWDWLARAARPHVAKALKAHGDGWSMAGGVCVAKQAAIESAIKAGAKVN